MAEMIDRVITLSSISVAALTEEVRQALEEAWAEGYHAGSMDEFRGQPETTRNPYKDPA